MDCPYESNPPAQYEWTRVPSCGSIGELLSWPQRTILFNINDKTLRLDGVLPIHYGYYNCSATNAFGSGWFCFWRIIDGRWLIADKDIILFYLLQYIHIAMYVYNHAVIALLCS